jgi:hypothetical protein
MPIFDPRDFLRNVLLLDAATCVVTGALMSAGAEYLSSLTQIPHGILWAAGLILLPVAAFIAAVATLGTPPAGVWLVIAGNVAWVIGSIVLLLARGVAFNALGVTFVVIQAAAVAILAELEFMGLYRTPARA